MMFETQLRRHKFVKGLHLFQESPKLYEEPLGVGSPLFPNFGGKKHGSVEEIHLSTRNLQFMPLFRFRVQAVFSFGPRSIKMHPSLPIKLQIFQPKKTHQALPHHTMFFLPAENGKIWQTFDTINSFSTKKNISLCMLVDGCTFRLRNSS